MEFLSKIRKRTSTWTLILAFTFLIQVYRWSVADMVIFGVLTAILFFESAKFSWKYNGIEVNQTSAAIFAVISSIYLFTSKRQEFSLAGYFLLLAFLTLISIWRAKDDAHKLTKREFASALYWSAIAGLLGLWEFLALVLSRIVKDDKAFPTISELLVPKLDSKFERLQFTLIWLTIGFYFFEKWRKDE